MFQPRQAQGYLDHDEKRDLRRGVQEVVEDIGAVVHKGHGHAELSEEADYDFLVDLAGWLVSSGSGRGRGRYLSSAARMCMLNRQRDGVARLSLMESSEY
jgi:hypothetical protein